MDILIVFSTIWFISLLMWGCSLTMKNGLWKNILGSIAIYIEFFSGIIIAPLIPWLNGDGIVIAVIYLLFVFSPVCILTKLLSLSVEKKSNGTEKFNISWLSGAIISSYISLSAFPYVDAYFGTSDLLFIFILLLPILIYIVAALIAIVKKIRMAMRSNKKAAHTEKLKLSDHQKIFFGFFLVSIVLIILALSGLKFDIGFFVFLRIVTCIAFIGLLNSKFPIWLKFIFILMAILYNPVIQIHLDRDTWDLFNLLTIPVLIVPWCIILRRQKHQQEN